jgi:hypothetical protein
MVTEEDYLQCAAKALNLAQRAAKPEHKAHLLAMAAAWHDLADRTRGKRLLKRHRETHPLATKPV